MLAATAALVRALGYDGVGMCEFKWNRRSDAFVFIELNARFWGSLALAVASGADFPWFLFQYRVCGKRSFPTTFRTNLYCRHLSLDTNWMLGNARHNRRDPLLATLPWTTVAAELLHVLRGRERIDTLTIDDPRPFFGEIYDLVDSVWRRATNKFLTQWKSMSCVRRREAGRLRSRFKEAKTIEVVCYGNICRSPMAAALLRKYHPRGASDVVINSAGLHAKENRECPPLAVSMAKNFGIDLTGHRSTRITAERVERADLILVADFENLWLMRQQFPNAAAKIFLIGIVDFKNPCAIADPWGGSIEVFQHTYTRIKTICQMLSLDPLRER
jgi:protein-tyrosine-phosphatase